MGQLPFDRLKRADEFNRIAQALLRANVIAIVDPESEDSILILHGDGRGHYPQERDYTVRFRPAGWANITTKDGRFFVGFDKLYPHDAIAYVVRWLGAEIDGFSFKEQGDGSINEPPT